MDKFADFNQIFLDNIEKVFPSTQTYRLRQYDKEAKAINGQMPKSSKMIPLDLADIPKRNSDTQRYSIFFSPNGEYKGKSSRTKVDAGNIYTLLVERDDAPDMMIEYRKYFELEPSIVIKTMKSFHCYRLLKSPLPVDRLKDWLKVNTALCTKFGGDPSVNDVTQCMRLPGSVHWKNDIKGPTTTCIKFDPNIKYELDDFNAYLEEESIIQEVMKFKKEYKARKNDSGEDIYDIIQKSVDVREVLHDLFPEYQVKGEDIYEGGSVTSGYKYKNDGNYINNFTKEKVERPMGGPFHIARAHFNSSAKAYRYFYDNYNIGERLENKITESTVKNVNDDPTIKIEMGSSTLEFDPKECIIKKTSSDEKFVGEQVICVGYLRVLGYYVREDGLHVYIVKYKKKTGDEGTIELKKISNLKELTAALAQVGLTFHGNKFDVGAIMEHVHGTTNKYIYITSLGIHSKDLIITKAGRYILDNKYYVDCQGVISGDRENNTVMTIGKNIKKENFRSIVESLKDVYYEPIIYSMFCMYGCSLISKFIRDNIGHLPLLTMVGMSHSGKTSTRHLMMALFGIDHSLETHASATEFSIIGLMKHYLPVHMAEYNNSVLRFNFDIFVKNVYDGTGTTRGRQDLSVVKYEFNSTVVVDGQTRTLDPAVYSRTITLFFMENYMKQQSNNPTNINKYIIDKHDELKDKFVRIYNEWLVLLKLDTDSLKISDKSRILENYALLYAFAEMYDILDIVKEHLDKQLSISFNMKGEEDLDKIIKEVFNIGILSNLVARFEGQYIVVEFYVDTLRYDKKKIEDIQSSIQAVNHRFGVDNPSMDNLYIPLDHIFKTKTLHNLFIKFLTKLEAYNRPEYGAAGVAIKQFCDANNFRDVPFYESLYYRR